MPKKYNIILDLDQTLISAEDMDDSEGELPDLKDNDHFIDEDGEYIIFTRPYLQTFLDFLFKHFNVSIWTAGTKNYAMDVINNIIIKPNPKRKLDYIFFRYHCKLCNDIAGKDKKLSVLWDIYGFENYNENNTVIIDDNTRDVCSYQTKNAINLPAFEALYIKKDDPKDNVLKIIRTELSKCVKGKSTLTECTKRLNNRFK